MNDTVKLITIQNKVVYDNIMNTGIYKLNKNSDFAKNYYKHFGLYLNQLLSLSKYLRWDNNIVPIFCLVEKFSGLAYGANYDYSDDTSSILLELDVPKKYVTFQSFNDWDDYINDTAWNNYVYNNANLSSTIYKKLPKTDRITCPIQAVIPYIKKDWIVSVSNKPLVIEAFAKYHIMTGMANITGDISYYEDIARQWTIQDKIRSKQTVNQKAEVV